jgi:hypothetical protein
MITAVNTSKSAPDNKAHTARYGETNELPPNFKEITEADFAKSIFFIHSPDFWEYRHITSPKDIKKFKWGAKGKELSTHFTLRLAYFYDGTGFAIAHDYWAGRVRYFSFAVCEHKEKTCRNVGNCLNTYTCKACGFTETIDSSD